MTPAATGARKKEDRPRIGARDGGGATVRAAPCRAPQKKRPMGAGGHKFEWKDKTNDGTTYLDALDPLDPGDPLYSSGAEDDENYVLVSDDVTAGDDVVSLSSSSTDVPAKKSSSSGASSTKVSYCAGPPKVVIGPKYVLAEFKRRLGKCLDELYSSGDVEEAVAIVRECECPEFAFEIIKRGVSKALDRRAHERELTSKLFAACAADSVVAPRDAARGFERLFESMEDLLLDAPLAQSVVSDFLIRCVVDEVLPPACLVDRVFVALGGAVVDRARRVLSRDHAGAKLERIWGPGDGRDAADLKVSVDQLIAEYLASRDLAEAVRCVRELEAPNFGHEVVKRAVTFALPKNEGAHRAVSELLEALLTDDQTSPTLSSRQAKLGFDRLFKALDDLKLDVPNAHDLLLQFKDRALSGKVLPPDYEPPLALPSAAPPPSSSSSEVVAVVSNDDAPPLDLPAQPELLTASAA